MQTEFFFVDDDLYVIAELVLDHGCVIVPDVPLTEPRVIELRSLEQVKECRQRRCASNYFILHPSWQRAPLETTRRITGNESHYSIARRRGGPTIDVLAPS